MVIHENDSCGLLQNLSTMNSLLMYLYIAYIFHTEDAHIHTYSIITGSPLQLT